MLGVLCSVPPTMVCAVPVIAVVITGKFCRLFAPVSASPASFRVTPLAGVGPPTVRSMPSDPLL